jgi:hypothetical protein
VPVHFCFQEKADCLIGGDYSEGVGVGQQSAYLFELNAAEISVNKGLHLQKVACILRTLALREFLFISALEAKRALFRPRA